MHAAFRKDILRTIRGNLKRFVAIVVITILGTAMFSGLKAGCDDLRTAADDFYDSQQLFDMRVLSTLGITQDDVDTLAGIEGVAHAEGGYAETAHVKVAGERASVDVKALSDSGINEPYLVEGELPDSAGEVAVTRGYLKDSGASIGDTLTIEDAEDEANEVFERRDYTIVGAVIDPMEVNNAEGSMSFRAASSSDYAFFVTQDDVVADTFTVAYVRLVGADEVLCYSDEYDDIVSQVTDRIDAVSDERAQARTDEVIGDALKQVEDGEREAQESFDEAEQAPAYDGYEQETMHVADVVASSPRHPERSAQREVEVEVEGSPDDPQYLYLLCRNRFAEGDELEVLAPHESSRRLIVRDLHWLNTFGPDNHDEDAPATVKEALSRATATDWEPAAAANRSCNLYRILVGDASRYASDGSASAALSVSDKAVCDESAPFAIPEGSFLRKRTFRRSARHEDKERL